jgi:hypothetical protein
LAVARVLDLLSPWGILVWSFEIVCQAKGTLVLGLVVYYVLDLGLVIEIEVKGTFAIG